MFVILFLRWLYILLVYLGLSFLIDLFVVSESRVSKLDMFGFLVGLK